MFLFWKQIAPRLISQGRRSLKKRGGVGRERRRFRLSPPLACEGRYLKETYRDRVERTLLCGGSATTGGEEKGLKSGEEGEGKKRNARKKENNHNTFFLLYWFQSCCTSSFRAKPGGF